MPSATTIKYSQVMSPDRGSCAAVSESNCFATILISPDTIQIKSMAAPGVRVAATREWGVCLKTRATAGETGGAGITGSVRGSNDS